MNSASNAAVVAAQAQVEACQREVREALASRDYARQQVAFEALRSAQAILADEIRRSRQVSN